MTGHLLAGSGPAILATMATLFSALAQRIRGVSDAHEAVQAMRDFAEHSQNIRVVLYTNAKRLSDVLAQRGDNVSEILSTEDVNAELTAGYLSFVGGKLARKTSLSERIELTPLMKAILLEETEKELGRLIDLTIEEPRAGHLLRHVGRAWLFGPWNERVSNSDLERDLGLGALTTLDEARAEQAKKLAWGKPNDPGTIVWIAQESCPLAAIGTFSNADDDSFASYGSPPLGLLGLFEAKLDPWVLVSPLLVWHESAETDEAPP